MRGGRKFKFCCILKKGKKKKKNQSFTLHYGRTKSDRISMRQKCFGYWATIPEVNWQGRGVNHAFPFRAEFKG